jgi:aromatic-L-amino-acid decarboxylase
MHTTTVKAKNTSVSSIDAAYTEGLTFTASELKTLGHQIADDVADYLGGIQSQPVWQPMPQDVRTLLRSQPLPEYGQPFPETLAFFQQNILPYAQGNGHPRFGGWINSAPAHAAVLMKPLATAMNPNCGIGDHAGQELERRVVQWIMQLCHFPVEGSAGVFVSGGSEANFTCLQAARHWAAQQDGWNIRTEGLQSHHPPFVLYQSDQGHFSIRKSVEAMGLGSDSIHIVRSMPDFTFDMQHLAQRIQEDLAAGLRPFCVVATAGTVDTGAIDDFDALADLCTEYGLWLHVDGSYGAFGVLDERVAPLYKGIERVDSLATDQHKWLSVPIDCGCALVKNAAVLHAAFRLTHDDEDEHSSWMSEYTLQRTRRFRALDVWSTIRTAGRAGLASAIARNITHARQLADLIVLAPELELVATGPLSIVRFRAVPSALRNQPDQVDQYNRELVHLIQQRGNAFLTSTKFQGHEAIRACLVNYLTTADDIQTIVDEIVAVSKAMQQ